MPRQHFNQRKGYIMSKKKAPTDRTHFLETGERAALWVAAVVSLTGILASKLMQRSGQDPASKNRRRRTNPGQLYGNLIHALSQNLRTPLAAIMGNSLLYLEHYKALNETEKLSLVKHIHEDSEWLAGMTENFLAVTHMQETGQNGGIQEEIVEEVLGEVLQKMENRHPDFRIRVTIPEEMISLPMNAMLIERVFINLLENALYHSGSQKAVDIIVKNGTSKVTFIVRDYGQGIPQEVLQKLSGKASPPDDPRVSHGQTGIGLTLCKVILSAHHGSFTGRNHSRGAEFLFTLPKKGAQNPR